MKTVGTTLLLLFIQVAAWTVPYKPAKYCKATQGPDFCGDQPGSGNGYTCLHWHPDHEFCEDETAPLPSCCRATEKGSGYTGCACCATVHGSKRIDVQKRGTYQHIRDLRPEVEYAQ